MERGGENKKKGKEKDEEKRRARSRSHRESGPLSRDARIQAQSIGLRVEEARTGSSSDRDSTIFDVEFVDSEPRAELCNPRRVGGVRWREIAVSSRNARDKNSEEEEEEERKRRFHPRNEEVDEGERRGHAPSVSDFIYRAVAFCFTVNTPGI